MHVHKQHQIGNQSKCVANKRLYLKSVKRADHQSALLPICPSGHFWYCTAKNTGKGLDDHYNKEMSVKPFTRNLKLQTRVHYQSLDNGFLLHILNVLNFPRS